jgi:hypothetical protein
LAIGKLDSVLGRRAAATFARAIARLLSNKCTAP